MRLQSEIVDAQGLISEGNESNGNVDQASLPGSTMSWRRVMPSPVARQAPRSLCSPLGSKHRGAGWPGEGHLAWKTHPQHIESSFQMTKNKRRQRTQQPDLQITIAPASNNTSNNRSSALISASTNSSDNEIYENTLSSPLFTTKPSEQPKPRNSLHPDTIKLTPTSIPRSSASAAASASSDDHSIHDDQSLADEQQQQEDLENHLDQAEEYSPQDENSHWQHTARSDDDDDQDDDQDDRDGRSNGSENGEREPLVHHSHHDQPISEGSYSSSDNPRLDGYPRHSKARQRRKVYGGGRLDWGGELEIWEVGLGVASNMYVKNNNKKLRKIQLLIFFYYRLSPAPLFIPHAFLLLGLPIGLPVLFLIGFVAWFSQVVLVVCGRYVGGRTYAQVASAVLPDRLKGCNIWFGETVVELCRVFVAGGRGMVNMMMVSDLFSQLTRQYTPKAAILYSRVFIIAFVGLLSLLPNFLRPRRPLFLPALFPTLSRLPLLLTALWPIAIGIIAFRLRQLNRELGRKLPPTGEGDVYSEIMGGTVWGGFSILLFCLSTPQHTFKHFRSLKRINKPPGNTTHPMRPLASHSAEDGSAVPVADPLFAGTSRSSIFSSYTLRRYSWESAALLGVVYSTLICLSWGLVGYLGMEHGGYEVNFLASLPSNDPWISSSRVILLVVLIPSIPNGGEGSTIEVLGCVGSTIIAGLIPSVFWIVLFHIRKARPILNINPSNPPSPTASISRTIDNPVRPGARSRIASNSPLPVSARRPSGADQLLIIKEAQLQKRLSGRRIWQDIGIFGILIPFCSVVLLKGLIAVSHETGPPPPIS
ncbi:hypothetical protein PtA15_6A416 [Puccinia triticina]|uniref:Amino acid transporter transmembrane domain-containing protein n=1 Tax=Puccinia triticina TaxID=208348 RepID=A0ABY7CP69_9BASI|nr:uncharacterized protein PtA15_6A416 [Puccinia triticina]WAQ85787.1 hypothetical protein PtA15_6A416 [Puccinia triticina]